MMYRWVADSRLATFGRRLVITAAVLGLTTVGSAGVAYSASTVGNSPSAKVVSHAPTAVSVTFKEPLRGGGARMRVLSVDGDVGAGRVSTRRKTLRRDVQLGAPPGKYTVEWTAVSAKGRKMSGQFSFQAARSNGEAAPPAPTHSAGALSAGRSGGSGSEQNGSTGLTAIPLTAIPLTVGGLLVLVAGIVSFVNRPRLRG